MRLGLYKRVPVMISHKNKGRFKFWLITDIILLILLFLLYLFFSRIYPNFISRVEFYANNLATTTINNTLTEVFKTDFDKSSFVNLSTDKDGKVTSVEADTIAMNTFKSSLVEKLQSNIKNLPDGYITIPIGSLFKNEIFSGVGPRIKIKTVPNGIVRVDFSEEFISCGINQVKHRIYLDVSLTISLVSTTMYKTQTVNTTVPVSETVISGVVPNYYGGNMNYSAPAQ